MSQRIIMLWVETITDIMSVSLIILFIVDKLYCSYSIGDFLFHKTPWHVDQRLCVTGQVEYVNLVDPQRKRRLQVWVKKVFTNFFIFLTPSRVCVLSFVVNKYVNWRYICSRRKKVVTFSYQNQSAPTCTAYVNIKHYQIMYVQNCIRIVQIFKKTDKQTVAKHIIWVQSMFFRKLKEDFSFQLN